MLVPAESTAEPPHPDLPDACKKDSTMRASTEPDRVPTCLKPQLVPGLLCVDVTVGAVKVFLFESGWVMFSNHRIDPYAPSDIALIVASRMEVFEGYTANATILLPL